jgi:hypothetical protein
MDLNVHEEYNTNTFFRDILTFENKNINLFPNVGHQSRSDVEPLPGRTEPSVTLLHKSETSQTKS